MWVEALALGDTEGGWVALMEDGTCPEGNQAIAMLD